MTRTLRIAAVVGLAVLCSGAAGCDHAETVTDRATSSADATPEQARQTEPASSTAAATPAGSEPTVLDTAAAAASSPATTEPASTAAAKQATAVASAATPAASTATTTAAAASPVRTPAGRPPVEFASEAPRPSRLGPTRSGRTAGGVQEITFDTIKFPMEKEEKFERSMLTPQILALEGQSIRIRGYILPSFQQSGITQFVLVRDNLQCCFGPGAALFDCIIVEMKQGKSTDYTVRPVSVEGKFTLAELVNPDDGKHLAIYHLDGEKVE